MALRLTAPRAGIAPQARGKRLSKASPTPSTSARHLPSARTSPCGCICAFTRLTNGFSKKVEAHANAVALHFMYYNFVRIHATLRMTPAMAAGVTGKLWEIADIIALIEAKESEKPAVRGPYRKQT